MDMVKGSAAYAEPMLLHRNLRNGTFEEVSKAAGLADMPLKSRRGAAFGDVANNGNYDIVVLNVGEPPSLLLNTNKIANHRVHFRLIGTKSNRAAIGETLKDLPADKIYTIVEEHGIQDSAPFSDLPAHLP